MHDNEELKEHYEPTIESYDLIVDDETPFETDQKNLRNIHLSKDGNDLPVKNIRDLLEEYVPSFEPCQMTADQLFK